ncbi:unnamed protein product [Auanema sp. JU1783]|nr:unnamed protein product [Auanema sp. JU1783]
MEHNGTLGRGHVFPLENYKKNARVWHRHPELVWISGELEEDISFQSKTVKIKLENDQHVEYPISSPDQLPFLRNPTILLGKDDLTALSYLHEPAVLHNLHYRFVERENIYTYCGIVLVAINPYADCSHLYGDDVIQVYRGVGKQVRDLDPHIYAVAEEAFFDLSEFGKCQSIIVSGESGAGKTVSAKFVMRYLASIASSRKGSMGIEERVLATNPIMEAIGNAKTIRNDNSSRFGKYIQINFGDRFAISGAEMKTYLLEKSRLVFQAKNERNYHIFYQMCRSRDVPMLKNLQLGPCESYLYTRQGGDSRIPGVDDRKDFDETLKAFNKLGFSEDVQQHVMTVLGGILLLGNIQFTDVDDNCSVTEENAQDIERFCQDLYQIPANELKLWLTIREIRAAGEVVRKGLSKTDAVRSRDALSKLIYASMFHWLVEKMNEALMPKDRKIRRNEKFVGVLDIYGFETFEINSFEQFCINYANEKLQQQFNQHVFKLEQEEYEREEIAWVRIEFYDNQPAIDLIEGRPGLIDYLDEQCKVVRGSDDGWLNQMTNCPVLKKNAQLSMPRIKSRDFIVKHFAADVSYCTTGFLEKNRDTVSEQLLEVIGNTKFKFLLEVLGPIVVVDHSAGGKRLVKKTVASQFRDSLKELMEVLCTTRPHYVRCIKPNDVKERYYFEPKRAIQQLRACGVLETVRISAAGFPSRWPYEDFGRRYRVLFPEGKALWRDKPKMFAEKACEKCLEPDKFALGKTKIFFRTGQVALLERIRIETLSVSAVLIQSCWRGYIARKRYEEYKQNIKLIQAATRAYMFYRRLKFLQMYRAIVTIQCAVRRHQAEKKYKQMKHAALSIQSYYRGSIVRRQFEKMRYEQSAIILQKYWRGYLVRRDQIKRVQKIVIVQSCVRRWLAKRRLRELKIEARSVDHLQKLNTGLENKIIELQIKLDSANREKKKLAMIADNFAHAKAQITVLEEERPSLFAARERMEELELEVERLETECDVKEGEKGELENKLSEVQSRMALLQNESSSNITSLTESLNSCNKKMKEFEDENEKLKQLISAESGYRTQAENELAQMREQLLQNANLLSSPSFSRAGSVRDSENVKSDYKLNRSGNSGFLSLSSGSGDMDEMALIIKQNQMISELTTKLEQYQRDNERLKCLMEAATMVDSLDKRTSLRAFESHRLQELETSYGRLKVEFERLIAEKANYGVENMNIQMLFEKLIEENERCHEESAELRAMLTSRFERQSGNAGSPRPDSGHWSENHSEDGSTDLDEELCTERQCRQLKSLVENLSRVLTDRNKAIDILEKRLHEAVLPFRPSECSLDENIKGMHGQLNHLASENLALNDKLIRNSEELAEARAQLRGYTGGLGFSLDHTSDSEIVRLESLSKDSVEHSALLEVFNVPEFSRILFSDLKPRLARLLTKCFPSYLLLTAFRYYDHANDETALTGLFSTVHILLKDTITRSSDMDVLSVWFVNTWRLLNLLRQYGGEAAEKEWYAANNPKQNAQRLKSFDVSPIREQLKARVEDCYQNLMKKAIEPVLIPKIGPGILQHESSCDLMSVGVKQQLSRQASKETTKKGLDDLIDFLNFIHAKLSVYGADQMLLSQVFSQMSQWISALALNQLMYRKDLCNFEKAIQIKHNVTEVQSWLNTKGLSQHRDSFDPLVQACHLLQSRKDESNLETLCGEMTSKLKPRQVIGILQHYSPGQDFEESPVDPDFLIVLAKRLKEREDAAGVSEDDQKTFILPGTTYVTPFDTRPFVYSEFPLETLSLPSCLHLQQVCRLI